MTIRMRTMVHPDGTWVYVVDNVPIDEQDMFAAAFAAFTDNVRKRNERCMGGLVFHDPVQIPEDPPEIPWDMQPVAMEEPVSICDACRTAADSGNPDRPHCPVCARQIEVYRTDLPEDEQTLYSHGDGEGGKCDGSKGPPVYRPVGHCDGKCPCQHRRKGAWRGRPAH